MKLNRGKSYKVLAIKVDFPADIKERWIRQCKEKYSVLDPTNSTRNRIVEASIVDAYDRIGNSLIYDRRNEYGLLTQT